MCVCVYSAKKKAAAAAKDLPMPPARETGQDKEKADKKREAGRLAVQLQRHRANQHPDDNKNLCQGATYEVLLRKESRERRVVEG